MHSSGGHGLGLWTPKILGVFLRNGGGIDIFSGEAVWRDFSELE